MVSNICKRAGVEPSKPSKDKPSDPAGTNRLLVQAALLQGSGTGQGASNAESGQIIWLPHTALYTHDDMWLRSAACAAAELGSSWWAAWTWPGTAPLADLHTLTYSAAKQSTVHRLPLTRVQLSSAFCSFEIESLDPFTGVHHSMSTTVTAAGTGIVFYFFGIGQLLPASFAAADFLA